MARGLIRATVALLAVGTVAVARAAAAAPPQAPENSIVQQYIEQVPTSRGPVPVVSSRGRHGHVSRAVVERIARLAGADRYLLQQVVSAAEFGAPQASLRPVLGAGETANPVGTAATIDRAALPLVGILALVSTAAGAAAILRRRRSPE